MILFIITPAENRPQLPHNWKVPVSTQSCNFLLASTIKKYTTTTVICLSSNPSCGGIHPHWHLWRRT